MDNLKNVEVEHTCGWEIVKEHLCFEALTLEHLCTQNAGSSEPPAPTYGQTWRQGTPVFQNIQESNNNPNTCLKKSGNQQQSTMIKNDNNTK